MEAEFFLESVQKIHYNTFGEGTGNGLVEGGNGGVGVSWKGSSVMSSHPLILISAQKKHLLGCPVSMAKRAHTFLSVHVLQGSLGMGPESAPQCLSASDCFSNTNPSSAKNKPPQE